MIFDGTDSNNGTKSHPCLQGDIIGDWREEVDVYKRQVHNSAHVLSFWEQRVKEVAGLDNLYTLGMRGVHDGAMNGAKTCLLYTSRCV